MFKFYFGDFSNGRLLRLPYLGYIVLLIILWIGFIFATVAAIGAAEHILGGDLAEAQAVLTKSLGIPYMIILGLVLLALFVASFNMMAKRARDMGLPGWMFVIGFLIVIWLVSFYVSDNAGSGLSSIVGLALLLLPSNTFGGNKA